MHIKNSQTGNLPGAKDSGGKDSSRRAGVLILATVIIVIGMHWVWGKPRLPADIKTVVRELASAKIIEKPPVANNAGTMVCVPHTTEEGVGVFYVNGVQVGTGSDSESVPYISAPLTIGMAEGQFYFNGLIDEVSIYNRTLSSNEVDTIYNAGQSGKCLPPPFTVTNQPANVSVSTGGTAKFSMGVAGLSPFSFQWALNGTNISGATNASLTLTNVSAANAGVYTATITNPLGGLTSIGAILTTVDIKMFAGIIINGVVGTNYPIESTSALQATNWMILTNTALPSLPYIYIDYSSITNPLQFYRAFPTP